MNNTTTAQGDKKMSRRHSTPPENWSTVYGTAMVDRERAKESKMRDHAKKREEFRSTGKRQTRKSADTVAIEELVMRMGVRTPQLKASDVVSRAKDMLFGGEYDYDGKNRKKVSRVLVRMALEGTLSISKYRQSHMMNGSTEAEYSINTSEIDFADVQSWAERKFESLMLLDDVHLRAIVDEALGGEEEREGRPRLKGLVSDSWKIAAEAIVAAKGW